MIGFRRLPGWFADSEDSSGLPTIARVSRALIIFCVAGFTITAFTWADRFSVAFLWACASGAVGFITGFIFGFPRSVTAPQQPAPQQGDSAANIRAARLAVNTNLEQVSDWMTKTLVGVGLVELKLMPARFARLARYAGETIGRPYTGSSAAQAAAALIAYFSALGFISGYLITRLYFQPEFSKGDNALNADAERVLRGAAPPAIDTGTLTRNDVPPPSSVAAAAERLKDVPVTASTAPEVSAAVARANIVARDPAKAVSAYRDAILKSPLNASLRFEYASALRQAGVAAAQVIVALRDSLTVESQSPDPDTRRKIFESLTYLLLYEPSPRGFTEAIACGETYTTDTRNLPSATVWINLAAAWGQRAAWESERNGGQIDRTVAEKAFNAIQESIRLDPGAKDFLAGLMNPSPQQQAAGENDLIAFRNEPRFRALLGLPPLE